MDKAGIVLIIPVDYGLETHRDEVEALIEACDGFHLAALRLETAGLKREAIVKRADCLREIGHRHDISVLIDDHPGLAKELGLDGVHLVRPSPKALRDARAMLSKDAIIGVHAGASKHDGMVLAEIGVDYVAFGPLRDLGLGADLAEVELFAWWSEMIEIPLIAEGGLDRGTVETIHDFVDFIALGDEVFSANTPIEALDGRLSAL